MKKIIAEIGWNHCGDMNLAKEMIKAAAESLGLIMLNFKLGRSTD
jgi:sialic acid synthase SpsE